MSNPFGDEKLKFPVDCHYKIITHNIAGIDVLITETLRNHGVKNPLREGSKSATGKYITYNVEVHAHSLEYMQLLDRSLRSISGVIMVL